MVKQKKWTVEFRSACCHTSHINGSPHTMQHF